MMLLVLKLTMSLLILTTVVLIVGFVVYDQSYDKHLKLGYSNQANVNVSADRKNRSSSLATTSVSEELIEQSKLAKLPVHKSRQISGILPRRSLDANKKPGRCACWVASRLAPLEMQPRFRLVPGGLYHVYSAYYDDRRPVPVILGIGLGTTGGGNGGNLWCVVWYKANHCDIVKALVKKMDLKQSKNPSTTFECSLNQGTIPKYVLFTQNVSHCDTEGAFLPVTHDKKWPPEHNLTVCVHGALINNISLDYRIMEFVEVYNMLEANKIAIYNHSGGPRLRATLEYYQDRGIVDLLDWSMSPLVSVFNGAQGSVIQDCIYRYMYHTQYLLLVNLDEFVFPRAHHDLVEMIQHSDCSGAAEIVFLNNFFHLGYDDDSYVTSNATVQHLRSVVLSKTIRDDFILSSRSRTKYMIRPELWLSGAIHRAGAALFHENKSCVMTTQLAILHHYRWRPGYWKNKGLADEKMKPTLDRTAYKFIDQIVDRLSLARRNIPSY